MRASQFCTERAEKRTQELHVRVTVDAIIEMRANPSSLRSWQFGIQITPRHLAKLETDGIVARRPSIMCVVALVVSHHHTDSDRDTGM
jgi:hypothetical protein